MKIYSIARYDKNTVFKIKKKKKNFNSVANDAKKK